MAEMNENREEEKAEGAAAADQTPGHESALTRVYGEGAEF